MSVFRPSVFCGSLGRGFYAIIPRTAIETYAQSTGSTYDATFGQVASAVQQLITHSDHKDVPADTKEVWEAFGALAAQGSAVTDADFCYIADLDSSDWDSFRHRSIPIGPAVAILGGITKPGGCVVAEVPLEGA